MSNGGIDQNAVRRIFCPTCDSRKNQYSLSYSRSCNGPKCITLARQERISESLTVRCDHIPDCSWTPWISFQQCSTKCATTSMETRMRFCKGQYCKSDRDQNVVEKIERHCPYIACCK